MVRSLIIFFAVLLGGPAFANENCRTLAYLGDSYTVCTFDPAIDDIRLYAADEAGKPYGSFGALEAGLWSERRYIRFAMNGGMYEEDQTPVGLYVENGVERKALDTKSGWGNFRLLPNGVFYIVGGKAGVMETSAFAAAGLRPDFATQSGPMLVIDGALHPAFLADSDSLKVRNGVGVAQDGKVVFAMSDGAVRFHDFGTLFRDALGCRNALFLDGSISSLYIPEWHRRDSRFPLGPIVAVTRHLPN